MARNFYFEDKIKSDKQFIKYPNSISRTCNV